MAKKRVVLESGLPTAIEKRNLVYGPPQPDGPDLRAIGEQCFAAGRLPEALDFFDRAGATDRVDAIRAKALEAGDFFLLARTAKIAPDKVSPADFEKAGDAAAAAGRLHYAVAAYERAAAESKLEDARAKLEQFQPGAAKAKVAAGAVASETEPEAPVSHADD